MNSPRRPWVGGPSDAAAQSRDDEEIARAQAGDRAAFEALWNRHRTLARDVALSVTGNRADAMEVAQQTCIRVWQALPRFQRGRPFAPWLYRIARNLALNLRRDRRRHWGEDLPEFVALPDTAPDPLATTLDHEAVTRVWREIGRLPAPLREVLVLHAVQGLKYREIADRLGIPIGTVMSRLFNARQRLRRQLGAEGA